MTIRWRSEQLVWHLVKCYYLAYALLEHRQQLYSVHSFWIVCHQKSALTLTLIIISACNECLGICSQIWVGSAFMPLLQFNYKCMFGSHSVRSQLKPSDQCFSASDHRLLSSSASDPLLRQNWNIALNRLYCLDAIQT